MKRFKAKVVDWVGGGFEIFVYSNNKWRSFGTPYSITNDQIDVFQTAFSAKKAATRLAGALGIELDWVK